MWREELIQIMGNRASPLHDRAAWPEQEPQKGNSIHWRRQPAGETSMKNHAGSETLLAADTPLLTRSLHDLWGFFLAEGIVMIVFGVIAITLPPIASLVVVILLGWLLVASGLVSLVTTLMGWHVPGFWWSLLSAMVTVIAGGLLYAWPLGGLISLSLALAAYLLLDGALSVAMALDHRRHLTPKWAWLLFNGVIDLVFAGVIMLWMPQIAIGALGLIVGIDMLISGATLVAMALDARKVE
jgi:uncharacterized membrane protein HdeD (DUF308 family)